MERKGSEPTLIDGLVADMGGPKTSSFLQSVAKVIDFEAIADEIRADVAPPQPKGGRPFVGVAIMLKCLMLAKWYGLSDPQLEEQLRDRLSFRRFAGLGLSDETPDETTFVNFRKRLRETGHFETIFARVLDQLRAKGLVLKEGSLIDATIIEAPRGGRNDLGQSTGAPCASTTKKAGQIYHGYKAHVNTSLDCFITDYIFDTASVHDSKHMDQLIEGETTAVYADSAYMAKKRSEELKARGVHDGIVHRRVRGQAELTDEQKAHNRAASRVRALVEHPFAWLTQMGYTRARYRGLFRNAMDFAANATAYNIKRSLSLLGMPLTPQPKPVY